MLKFSSDPKSVLIAQGNHEPMNLFQLKLLTGDTVKYLAALKSVLWT